VLKPGGRFLFVESAEVAGESFLEEVMKLSEGEMFAEDDDEEQDNEAESTTANDNQDEATDSQEQPEQQRTIIFSEVGFDNVDMVLQPHVAGVAIKALDADLTNQQRAEKQSQEEQDRLADLSLSAFERGSKKRRKKKTKGGDKKEGLGMKS
jgi:ABC-type Zn2+ transport system substrate-binding protein/surface adhesin